MKTAYAIAFAIFIAPLTAVAGPDWIERGDAGNNGQEAQRVTGSGVVTSISGSLSSGILGDDFEDLYIIRILAPATFSFTMANANFNSQLYLFALTEDNDLYGMLSNDDVSVFSTDAAIGQSFATDGTGARVVYKGLYCLAITSSGRYPVSPSGAIFYQATNTEISGPDGPGRYGALNGWEGPGGGGSYTIGLDGVGFADIPTPGAISVLAAGCLVSLRRRR